MNKQKNRVLIQSFTIEESPQTGWYIGFNADYSEVYTSRNAEDAKILEPAESENARRILLDRWPWCRVYVVPYNVEIDLVELENGNSTRTN